MNAQSPLIFSVMFWSDWGSRPEIERANLDGSGRTPIVSDDLVFPNGLALDYELNRLYWCDAGTDRIEYCDFDGRYLPVYYMYIYICT